MSDGPDLARAAWSQAWVEIGVPEPEGLLSDLLARYAEPHRVYHTLQHIGECFVALSPAAHVAQHLGEVRLALWFHDAIYDPRATDNEQASAELARHALLSAGVTEVEESRIRENILSTRHAERADNPDARLTADVDLAILAAPAQRFGEYEQQIRIEYSWMPQDEFDRRRSEVIDGFLARKSIYQTAWFGSRLEKAARANLGG
ncbi:MAG: HD domain-containing protein [Gemmatimonadaceae bacterium]